MGRKIVRIGQAGFVLLTFALLLYRITLHADVYDEIMNLNIAYRIVLGDIPFYHIQESYQVGAIFLVPFIWLFVKVTGSTTGIVLFSRVLYILVLVGCAAAAYRLFRRCMDKGNAFFLSYVIVFFEMLSMFYLWYDSLAVIFFWLGDIAILNALVEEKSIKKRYYYLILAGLLHSCMAFVHVALIPTALFIAVMICILFWLYREKKVGKVLSVLGAYAFVPIVAVGAIVIIGVATSKLDLLLETLLRMLTSRGLGSEAIDFVAIIKSIIVSYININFYFVKISIVLVALYILTWFLPKIFPVLALAIVVLPIYNQYLLPESSVQGLPNYLSYLALWAPLLYLMIKKKDVMDSGILCIGWIPMIISGIFIPLFSITGTNGPVKAWQMCLPGAMATLYFMARIWKQRIDYLDIGMCRFLYAIVSLTLLLNAYKYVYLNQPMIEFSDKRLTEGIYWGLKVNSDMECMVDIQRIVEKHSEGCETILASNDIRSVYLMTDLKPFTRSTENGTFSDGDTMRWRLQKEYFAKFNGLPDIMFLEAYDLQDEYFWDILNQNYVLIAEEATDLHYIYVYKKFEF